MTSQMYRPDDDQMGQENGQVIRADEQVAPDDDLGMTDREQTGHDEPVSFVRAAVAPADLEPAAPIASELPGSAPHGYGAESPGMDDNNAGDESLTPVGAVAASSVAESPVADDTASAAGPWSEIQAKFVDDPRESIELAAGLVDDRVTVIATSLRNRQQSLRSAWQGEDAGTEEMRLTLQHYRAFWHRLEDYPAE
jgi:hypothetical protein